MVRTFTRGFLFFLTGGAFSQGEKKILNFSFMETTMNFVATTIKIERTKKQLVINSPSVKETISKLITKTPF
jgi:hypothetical protein